MALRKISDLDYRDTPISTTNETMSIEALRKSDANYTESQIISLYEHGVTADLYKNVFIKKVFIDPHDEPTIEERSNLDFNDKVKLLQRAIKSHHDTWSIKNAIQSFDDDMLYQLAERNADVVHASYVKDSWRRDKKYSEFNTTENILRLATDNLDVDVFLRAADAGFSTDEIRLYPFLASGLLTKERNE